MKNLLPKHSLKVDILARVAIVVCLMLSFVVGYNNFSSKEMLLANARFFIKKQNNTVISKIYEYIESSKKLAESTAVLFGGIKPTSYSSTQHYILDVVKRIDSITSLTVALETGFLVSVAEVDGASFKGREFLGHKVPPHSKFSLAMVNSIKKQASNAFSFYNGKIQEIEKKEGGAPSFFKSYLSSGDYKTIAQVQKPTWSEIKVLENNGLKGIVYSLPIFNDSSKFLGAVSVSLTLKDVSFFLNDLRISEKSRLFVINNQGQIIADSNIPEEQEIKKTDNGDAEILLLALSHAASSQDENRIDDGIFKYQGKGYFSLATDFPEKTKMGWRVISIAPLEDFTTIFKEIEKNTLLISVVALLIVLLFLFLQTQKLSEPILELEIEAKKIQELDLDDPISLKSNVIEIENLATAMQRMKINVDNFSRYIPKAFVHRLIESGQEVETGGKEQDITLLFTDIADFTTISEASLPQDLMLHLSDYFEEMTDIILANDGTIDKFIGDAIMAFWGAPEADQNRTVKACRTALIFQQKLNALNKYWESLNKPSLVTRIGIHCGPAIVGNVGSSERMNYTALGDNVNLAARLEGINKMYGTRILVSNSVVQSLPNTFIVRPVDVVAVKGKEKGIKVYELVGLDNDPYINFTSELYKKFCSQFTIAFDLYLARRWEEALEKFLALNEENISKLHFPDKLVTL